jgi:tetratricopeptide (TPR) repeat protein
VFHEARLKRYFSPDPLDATRSYKKSVALYEKVGDRWGLARALAYLGWMVEQLGHFSEAQELCERSLSIRQELGDKRGVADAMLNLGIISWVQGRLDEAQRLLRESVSIFWELDDWIRIAQTFKSIGEVLVRRGQFDDGLVVLERSAGIYDDLGYDFGVWGTYPFLAEAKLHLGRYGEARADAQQGAGYAQRSKHLWGVAFSQLVSGLAEMAEGAGPEALVLFQASAAAFEGYRHQENQGWVLGPLGLAAREAGDPLLARQCVVGALEIGVDLGAFMPVMYGLPVAALLLANQGAAERAVEAYACACRYEFVANSRWFEELVGQQIRTTEASLPAEVAQAARARGQAQAWDAMAAELLTEL